MSRVFANYCDVKSEIHAAAEKAGRDSGEIRLLAVSKTFPVEPVRELYAAGVRCFGESRVNELAEKAAALPPDIEWHFIGNLQANKARKVLQLASVIHSVNSVALLERLERIAGEEKLCREFLLELNVSGESTKSGCAAAEEIRKLAQCAAQCGNLKWRGLMTMAPADVPAAELHQVFAGLRQWRERFEKEFDCKLPVLSMGMSGDFAVAVAEGSTLVRIGTAIFGGRG